MIYDGLLLTGVAFFSSALVIAVVMSLFKLIAPEIFFAAPDPEFPKLLERSEFGRIVGGVIVSINVLVVSFLFYGWFWTHGGQTLGMKAWNLYLVKPDGKFIDWKTAFKRYLAALLSWACLGLGFTWSLLNSNNRTWHDILTDTHIIKVKQSRKKKP